MAFVGDTHVMHCSDDSDEEAWANVENDDDDEVLEAAPTLCLFCTQIMPGAEGVLSHCKADHGFDIRHIHKLYQLDCFKYIKMVNYCRKHGTSVKELLEDPEALAMRWDSDEYMQPQLPDDTLLTYDIEELDEDDECDGHMRMELNNGHQEEKMQTHEAEMNQLLQDMSKLKGIIKDLAADKNEHSVPLHDAIQNLKDDDDDVYFGSYSHFSIHQDMLQDRVRTESYRDAIEKNSALFRDKVVLDVGCGTGILSMFAARAGAKKVIGIDQSDIICQAMDIVRENNLSDVITLIKGRVEDVDIPVEEVDIIISEWMGYFLLFESMLDTVLWARDRWLAPEGLILPNHCNISIAGVCDQDLYKNHVSYWSDVYGFKMSCMRSAVVKEASVQVIKPESLLTDACVIKDININKTTVKDLDFTGDFKITACKCGSLTALISYFDIWFDSMQEMVFFSTGPKSTPTHWKQTVFLLEEPIDLMTGDVLEGRLICRKNRKDPRSLKITISFRGKMLTYHME